MKLQSDNINRACIKEEGVHNYLSVNQWCKRMEVQNVDQILSYIAGFETGLPDGELEDKHLEIADVGYLGILSIDLDKNIKATIKEAA